MEVTAHKDKATGKWYYKVLNGIRCTETSEPIYTSGAAALDAGHKASN